MYISNPSYLCFHIQIPYKMKKILFILFAYFCLPSFGGIEGGCQPNRDKYRDQKWIFGYESENHHIGDYAGNTILDFSTEPPTATYQYMPMDFSAVSTSLCDTLGNLVCYTNGIYIADKTHQKMINGDSLDYGANWELYKNDGSGWIQGGVSILPIPTVKNSSVVLYADIDRQFPNPYFRAGLKAAFIDFNRNNGKGVVLQKDVQVFADTMNGVLATACRHANGRDWWLIGIKFGMSKYYKTLFTPNGFQTQLSQTMPFISSAQASSKVAYFSSDGKKYAHYSSGTGTWLYDFDRCTGELSNRQLIPAVLPIRTYFCGISFSPNSQYLYVTNDSIIVQYDLYAPNITTSGITVARYDYFRDSLGGNTAFFLLQLAPNGKIYGACTGTNHYLHIIHNPNERGLACNVEQHGLRLPTWYNSTMPNFPNFRLGSEPGTVCDSLGIETGVTDTTPTLPKGEGAAQIQLSVSPNPTSGECTVSLPHILQRRGDVRLYDISGKRLETFSNPFLSQPTLTINLKNYAKGVYVVEYAADGGGSTRARVVRQ
jgi:hypothetical protein